MAVALEFISLIAPIASIERAYRGSGGFDGFLASQASWLGDLVWYDNYLCRADGAMNAVDADGMVSAWEARGLKGLSLEDGGKHWEEFCIAISRSGPTAPCSWVEFDSEHNCVYWRGRGKGEVIGRRKLADEHAGGLVLTDPDRIGRDVAFVDVMGLAERGDPLAQYKIAELLEGGGKLNAQNLSDALGWYSKAARQGYEKARLKLLAHSMPRRADDVPIP